MLRLLFLLLLFSIKYADGQTPSNSFIDSEAIQIINSLRVTGLGEGYLTKKINNYSLTLLRNHFVGDTVLGHASLNKKKKTFSGDTIILTSSERQQISDALNHFEKFEWTVASTTGLNFTLEPTAAEVIKEGKRLGFPLYSITPPVFLRNRTLCLIYRDYSNGGGGRGSLFVYKKSSDGWKRYLEIELWTS